MKIVKEKCEKYELTDVEELKSDIIERIDFSQPYGLDIPKITKNILSIMQSEIHKDENTIRENERGMEAYQRGNFEEAKEHYISSISNCPDDDEFIAYNNLGYMLRRGEIGDISINGQLYDVPSILKKGVEARDSFSLVNMAMYVCMKGKKPDLRKGKPYIRKLNENDIASVKEYWEKLALDGELEGYIVLEWLYQCGYIVHSVAGSCKEIEHILKSKGLEIM